MYPTATQQQVRMFKYIAELLVQLRGFDCEWQLDNKRCKRVIVEINKYMKALNNNWNKTRGAPLKMISTTRDHHLCLSNESLLITALLWGLHTFIYGEEYLYRSIVHSVVSGITGYPKVVDVWIKTLYSIKVGYVGRLQHQMDDEPHLFITEKFKRILLAEPKPKKQLPEFKRISCQNLNDFNYKLLPKGVGLFCIGNLEQFTKRNNKKH